jgi:hypothetical protein
MAYSDITMLLILGSLVAILIIKLIDAYNSKE